MQAHMEEVVGKLEQCLKNGSRIEGDGLKCLIEDLKGVSLPNGRRRLGDIVEICSDRNWRGVITSVEERLGEIVHFKVEWRNGREFVERWFSAEELDAFEKLEEI